MPSSQQVEALYFFCINLLTNTNHILIYVPLAEWSIAVVCKTAVSDSNSGGHFSHMSATQGLASVDA